MSSKDQKKTKREQDGKFHSKNIKHDPLAESARAKFGLKSEHSEKDE